MTRYAEWFQSVTGVNRPAPNTFPAMSWTLDDKYGQQVNFAMVQAEAMFAAKLISELKTADVPGVIVEFGVFTGDWIERLYTACQEIAFDRPLYGFDSFEGLPEPDSESDLDCWKQGDYSAALDFVEKKLKTSERKDIHLIPGWFSDSLSTPNAQNIKDICFARIDCDLYASTVDCLEYLTNRLVDGSILVFDDWAFDIEKSETKAFFEWVPKVPHLRFEFLCFTSIGHIYFRVHYRDI